MLPYILHSSILLGGTFGLYWLLLRNETFFRLNRWILLGSVILSLTLPLITMPAGWTLQVQEQVASSNTSSSSSSKTIAESIPETAIITDAAQTEKENKSTAENLDFAPQQIDNSTTTQLNNSASLQLNTSTTLWYIYLTGVGIFSIAFLVQFAILLYRIIRFPAIKDGKYRIVELDDDQAPYSFLNCIFINPSQYEYETYNQIIAHEKIHIEQIHFFDKFIAEALVIAFWFNPFVWLYRKAITNNLEFLTDESMLDQGTEKESYQMSLLKVSVPHRPLNLTTNYNQSFLKSRIAMMNTKKSSAASSWKYLTILPMIALSLVTLNAVHIEENTTDLTTKKSIDTSSTDNNTAIIDTSRETIKASEGNIVMSPSPNGPSEIRTYRDQNGNIVRQEGDGKVLLTEVSNSNHLDVTQDSNINEITITTSTGRVTTDIEGASMINIQGDSDWNDLLPGEWSGRIKGNEYCLTFNNSPEGTRWRSFHSSCLPRSEFKASKTSDGSDLEVMTREAGKLELYGYWKDNDRGQGDFRFIPDADFINYMSSEGIRLKKEHQAFNLFMADVNRAYISFLKKSDFEIDGDGVLQLAVHNIDLEELKGLMGVFAQLNNKDYDLSDLVQFKIHNVTPTYVNELRVLGMDLNTNNVVQAAIHNVEPEFVKAMMDYGLREANMKDMIQFSIHNVEIDFLTEMKALGFDDLNSKEIVQLNIHNVDPSYVKEFRDMGYNDMDVNDIIQFAIHNIDPDYINSFKKSGIDNISKNDIVQAGIHNVDVNYVKAMQDAGFKDVDMDDMIQFSIHGVSTRYISDLKDAGLSDLSKSEIVNAKIHNVKPSYINEFRALGMDELAMKDIIQFAIHNIRPSFVKGFKAEGFEGLSKSQIVNAGIHNASPEYIKSIRELNIEIGDFGDIINAKIHGVSASFIKRAKEKGYSPKTLKEYTRLKISGI